MLMRAEQSGNGITSLFSVIIANLIDNIYLTCFCELVIKFLFYIDCSGVERSMIVLFAMLECIWTQQSLDYAGLG